MVTEITVRSGEDLRELRARAGNAKVIGTIVARLLARQSDQAFADEALGDFAWPERYPNMDDPSLCGSRRKAARSVRSTSTVAPS